MISQLENVTLVLVKGSGGNNSGGRRCFFRCSLLPGQGTGISDFCIFSRISRSVGRALQGAEAAFAPWVVQTFGNGAGQGQCKTEIQLCPLRKSWIPSSSLREGKERIALPRGAQEAPEQLHFLPLAADALWPPRAGAAPSGVGMRGFRAKGILPQTPPSSCIVARFLGGLEGAGCTERVWCHLQLHICGLQRFWALLRGEERRYKRFLWLERCGGPW